MNTTEKNKSWENLGFDEFDQLLEHDLGQTLKTVVLHAQLMAMGSKRDQLTFAGRQTPKLQRLMAAAMRAELLSDEDGMRLALACEMLGTEHNLLGHRPSFLQRMRSGDVSDPMLAVQQHYEQLAASRGRLRHEASAREAILMALRAQDIIGWIGNDGQMVQPREIYCQALDAWERMYPNDDDQLWEEGYPIVDWLREVNKDGAQLSTAQLLEVLEDIPEYVHNIVYQEWNPDNDIRGIQAQAPIELRPETAEELARWVISSLPEDVITLEQVIATVRGRMEALELARGLTIAERLFTRALAYNQLQAKVIGQIGLDSEPRIAGMPRPDQYANYMFPNHPTHPLELPEGSISAEQAQAWAEGWEELRALIESRPRHEQHNLAYGAAYPQRPESLHSSPGWSDAAIAAPLSRGLEAWLAVGKLYGHAGISVPEGLRERAAIPG